MRIKKNPDRWTQQYFAQRALFFVELHKMAKSQGQTQDVVQAIAQAAKSVMLVANLLKGNEEKEHCDACDDLGVLFLPTQVGDTAYPATVERCDSCKRFDNDEQARDELEFVFSGLHR